MTVSSGLVTRVPLAKQELNPSPVIPAPHLQSPVFFFMFITHSAPAAHMGLIWAQLNKFPSHLLSLAEREITSVSSLSAGELTWSTEVSTPGGDGAAAALPHLAGLADGAGLVRGVPVAGSSPGGEGLLVVGHSGTSLPTHFTVYILIVYVLHTQNGVFTHLNSTIYQYQPTSSYFTLYILTFLDLGF